MKRLINNNRNDSKIELKTINQANILTAKEMLMIYGGTVIPPYVK